MLHPKAKLRNSRIEGKGLIASDLIPKGTIFWIPSDLDKLRIYPFEKYKKFSSRYQQTIDKYSYPDGQGNLILSMNNDKYWNHSCNANVLDFPNKPMCIVVRDIKPGEEITYDYGLNLRENLKIRCNCGEKDCRKVIKRANKNSELYLGLLKKEKEATRYINKVPQPLLSQGKN